MGQQSVAANHVSLTRTVALHNRWLLIGSWFPSFCSEFSSSHPGLDLYEAGRLTQRRSEYWTNEPFE